jgi:uncharacterized protein (DUF1697 family)
MSSYVSLLRGINVGGQKKIRMETLRGIYTKLGFTHIGTYVQSGNVVFKSPEQDLLYLVRRIEAEIEKTCGYPVPVFIRQAHEMETILAGNPFINDMDDDPSKLHVTFLYQAPLEAGWGKLTHPDDIPDAFARGEEAIYLFCPNGYGRTKLSNSFFERKLGVVVTTRNWNTVKALYKMAVEE